MKLEEFDFYLPDELIAQTPLLKRDTSKLLSIDRNNNTYEHRVFSDIIEYFNPGDTLVLNNTRVMPARLYGQKKDTGAAIEVLLLKNKEHNMWECLVKPAKRIKVGSIVSFGDGIMEAECVKVLDDGFRYFEFKYEGIFQERLDELGTMPLPPYIKERLTDKERYQTVYSKEVGSSAAPTAGLHFTNELLEQIKSKGVNIVYLTLHVGLGTSGLNGEGIKLFKKIGDTVKKGEKIGTLDRNAITKAGISLVSPVTFLNVDKAKYGIKVEKTGNVEAGEETVIFITKK